LQKCLDYDKGGFTADTYGDLGELAFGSFGRSCISAIFFFELLAATIALIILSADSIVALFPVFSPTWIKIVVVEYASLVGIAALLNLITILFIDGLSTKVSPGSIWNPSDFEIYPNVWSIVPLAFGLLMAGKIYLK
jgi:vesicular inhibitory amino acid transporter